MVSPVIYNRTRASSDNRSVGSYHHTQNGYRQKKPYNQPTAYVSYRFIVTGRKDGVNLADNCQVMLNQGSADAKGKGAYSHTAGLNQSLLMTDVNGVLADITNQARERFISRMKTSVGVGTTLAERRQAMGMIANRGYQMLDFLRWIRKGNITRAADILGVRGHPSYSKLVKDMSLRGELRRNRFKQQIIRDRKIRGRLITEGDKKAADLFLEFHFGWEPLVKDIYGAVDLLQGEIPAGRIFGSARKSLSTKYSYKMDSTTTNSSTHKIDLRCKVGAQVHMKNANLGLANQMGLINPLSLAWEIVPYSFVVDWFANVGSFLESFTDTIGYTITNPYTTTVSTSTCDFVSIDTFYNRSPWFSSLSYSFSQQAQSSKRILDLPSVTLKMYDRVSLSPTRAITAISLLIQQGFRRY